MSKRILWRGACDQCGQPTSDFFGDEKAPTAEFCASCMKKFMKMNKRARGGKLLFLAGWRGVPDVDLTVDPKKRIKTKDDDFYDGFVTACGKRGIICFCDVCSTARSGKTAEKAKVPVS